VTTCKKLEDALNTYRVSTSPNSEPPYAFLGQQKQREIMQQQFSSTQLLGMLANLNDRHRGLFSDRHVAFYEEQNKIAKEMDSNASLDPQDFGELMKLA
jgi:hypothetical protein